MWEQFFLQNLLECKFIIYTLLLSHHGIVELNVPDLEDVKEGEGDGEKTEEEVRYGHVGDEDVLGR